ncbi:MAG: hypothetical protein QOF61_324 [Acidobacteriota bacterium]|nr:hypothetical protein [Acidobacteriota bacterium]
MLTINISAFISDSPRFAAFLWQVLAQEGKSVPEWLTRLLARLSPTGWAVLIALVLLALALIFYFFEVEGLELGLPPTVKLKRRASASQTETATQPHAASAQPPHQTPAPKPATAIQPNLVHPYGLQKNFTGRVNERKELTAWLDDDARPVCALIAMGGMGKSALAWYWMKNDVLASAQPAASTVEGVMWWSFYEGESSFAKFIDEALRYVSGQPIDAARLPTTYDRAQDLRQQLQTKRVLFVLDGFERQLRAYAGLNAAYQQDETKDPSQEERACVDQIGARWLTGIAAGASRAKVLLTTRLMVRDLEDRAGEALAGVLKQELKELPRDDAVAFMLAQGVTKGASAEIAKVCAEYGNHPLSLRLLSGLIKHDARMPGDIAAAPRHDVHANLVQRQHHVLEQSYAVLPAQESALLSRIAAFRIPMTYDALAIFNDFGDEKNFAAALEDLRVRGLLQRDTARSRFDLHPIVRHYAYDRLTDKTSVHIRLRDYFATIPAPDGDKVRSIEELAPTIELYHHTVRAGQYDEALELFRNQLADSLFYRFGAYQTQIDLLRLLFPNGEHAPPQLQEEGNQGWAQNQLANSYSLSGQPRNAVPLLKQQIILREKLDQGSNLAIGLANIAGNQLELGEFIAAEQNLKRAAELSREETNLFDEAIDHQELGLLLAYRGAFDEAENEFDRGIKLHTETLDGLWWRGTSWLYRAQSALLRHDASQAIKSAREATRLKDIEYPGVGKVERDIIRAEWLLGAALVMKGKDLRTAATYLDEALTRCRRINLVESEPDILLTVARLYRVRGEMQEARANAEDALAIADRCEFRLKQAEIHNFLARLALTAGDRAAARQHAETARERAWCDGPPHCYKPALDEAEAMLKRADKRGWKQLIARAFTSG